MASTKLFNIFLLIAAIAILINVGSYGVTESSDARYAEISRKMFVSGDYMHPDLLDVHHYHKPPLTYQITALGYSLFGINSFGARFFLQIAILIQLILVFQLSKLLFSNEKTALWASIIYFSFPLVLISSRNLTTDAFLATFELLSVYCWVVYRKKGNTKWLYFFTISLALGFLTKGPVVFIIPVIFTLFFNTSEKAKHKINIHHLLAWLLFIAIAGSWFFYLVAENSIFLDYFLGRQTADRFSENVFGRTEPFWYFLAFTPLVGLPWFLVLLYLLKINKRLIKYRSTYLTLLLSCIIPLIFFSISSSKRILYILPIYSMLAILTAQLFTLTGEHKLKPIKYIVIIFILLVSASFIAAPLIDKIDLNLPISIAILGLLLILTTFIIFKKTALSGKSKLVTLTLITTVVLLITSSYVFSNNELKVNATKPITDFIKQQKLSDRNILVYNTRKSSIAFGLNKSIISLNNGHESLARETQFETSENWKKYLIDLKNDDEVNYLKQLLEQPTVLISNKKLASNTEWILNRYKNKKVMGKWTIYY